MSIPTKYNKTILISKSDTVSNEVDNDKLSLNDIYLLFGKPS